MKTQSTDEDLKAAIEDQNPFDEVLESAPTEPSHQYKYTTIGKPYTYYKSLNGKWAMWWDEFATALDERGRLKYKTIWSFIKAKTKVDSQRAMLFEMLGSEPAKTNKLRVPWLGDWQKRRESGFLVFNKTKLKALNQAYHQKKEALDAAREIAPITVRDIARFESLGQMIDTAFGGMPIDPNEAPDSPRNVKRLRLYLSMQKKVLDIKADCFGEYYKAFGLNPTEPEHWLNIRGMDQIQPGAQRMQHALEAAAPGDPVVLDGHELRQVSLPDGVNLDDLLLAKALRDKAKMYKMTLPGELNKFVEDTTKEDVDRVKGKRTN